MTLREREIEYEKLNSAVIIPPKVTSYCPKDFKRIEIDLSKGQIEQNPLRSI